MEFSAKERYTILLYALNDVFREKNQRVSPKILTLITRGPKNTNLK